jgi:hypothetical protein
MSSNASAPVESKVVAGAATTAVTGIITWVLVTFIFHRALQPELASMLPYLVGAVLGPVAAYGAKHTPRIEEVAAQVAAALGQQQAAEDITPGASAL